MLIDFIINFSTLINEHKICTDLLHYLCCKVLGLGTFSSDDKIKTEI